MIPFTRHDKEPALPDVTPLMDVVFILLIFFVIAAAFAVHGLDIDLPESSSSRNYAGRALEITLQPDGALLCDGEPVTEHDLGFIIADNCAATSTRRPKQVLFKTSSAASVGRFMRTVDIIRSHGGERLVIATESVTPPTDEP